MVDYLHTIPGDGSRYRYSCHWPRCRSSNPGSINVELERLLGIHKPPETVDLRLKGWEKLELWRLLVWPTCTKVGVMISLFYMYVYIYIQSYIYVCMYTHCIHNHFACWTIGFQNHGDFLQVNFSSLRKSRPNLPVPDFPFVPIHSRRLTSQFPEQRRSRSFRGFGDHKYQKSYTISEKKVKLRYIESSFMTWLV